MSYVIPIYKRLPLRVVRGEGIYLFDEHNEAYIDGACGYAVTNLGHGHPVLRAALHAQIDTLWHSGNMVVVPQQEHLAERVCKLAGMKKAFFCNSGAEAWEATVKIARKYFADRGEAHRHRGIVLKGCFHGRTIAGISAAKRDYMINGFAPLLDTFDQVEPTLEAIENAISPSTAFINVEPVLGEGGLRALSDDFMRGIKQLADRHDLLLVFDEVQSGMGRTGKLFAYEWAGITPDILSLAKGLGCGFPLGAFVVGEKCQNTLGFASHGTTFGGNPLAMSVGNAVLDVMTEPGFLDHVNKMGQRLYDALLKLSREFPSILTEEVRGRGLMRAVTCQPAVDNYGFADACFREKLLLIPAMENVVRVMPSLLIQPDEVDEIVTRMRRACAAWQK